MANETEGHGREAKRKAVIDALRGGNTRRAAAAYAGINADTFYDWLKSDSTFSDAVEKAEADAEVRAVSGIVAAAKKSWQAYAWWLERHPRLKADWRQVSGVEMSGELNVKRYECVDEEEV